jgi:(p)ppGpp synthase/HD superfamily hydrolase
MRQAQQMINILENAIQVATHYHSGQIRKDSSFLPYIVHPLEVMKVLHDAGVRDQIVLASAILHDTLEDTNISPNEIKEKFGSEVLKLVQELTFIKDKSWGKEEKEKKKTEYLQSFANKSIESLLIKIVDRICNSTDYTTRSNPEYASIYFEKALCIFDVFFKKEDEIVKRFRREVFEKLNHQIKLIKKYLGVDDLEELT